MTDEGRREERGEESIGEMNETSLAITRIEVAIALTFTFRLMLARRKPAPPNPDKDRHLD